MWLVAVGVGNDPKWTSSVILGVWIRKSPLWEELYVTTIQIDVNLTGLSVEIPNQK